MANIINSTYYTLLSGTSGKDTIINEGDHVTIDGGKGNDYIYNEGYNTSISGGANNDVIYNSHNHSYKSGSYDTIDGGAGDDSICSSSYCIINGGSGNDYISLPYADNVTIMAGKGDDTIDSGGTPIFYVPMLYLYAEGDGNDVIYNYNNSSVVSITSGSFDTSTIGNDVLIKVGEGTITLVGAKGKYINVYPKNFTTGDDVYFNYAENARLSALDGNDYIVNYSKNVTVDGGADNDKIYTHGYSSINGGADNDTLYAGLSYNTVNGGSGNDSIKVGYGFMDDLVDGGDGDDEIILGNPLEDNTVVGGKGDDTIYSENYGDGFIIYKYANSDGNDIVYGYTDDDMISITGASFTTSTVDNDVLINVGDGYIKLIDAKGKSINFNGRQKSLTNGNDNYENDISYALLNALAGDDIIYYSAD